MYISGYLSSSIFFTPQEFCKTTASMLDGVEVPSSSFCTSTDPNEKLGVTSGGDLIPSK